MPLIDEERDFFVFKKRRNIPSIYYTRSQSNILSHICNMLGGTLLTLRAVMKFLPLI